MRILLVSNYYPPFERGGMEQLAFDVVGGLRARGHEVRVLTSNYAVHQPRPPEHQVERVLHLCSRDHQRYHPLEVLARGRRERANLQALDRVVAEFAPEIAFVWGMWNLPHSIARHTEDRLEDRVVYYVASPWPGEPEAFRAYWRSPAARPWLRPLKRMAGAVALRADVTGQAAMPRFPKVLCVSEYMRSYMIDTVGVSPDRAHVVYNGIDVERFQPDAGSDALHVSRLLYAGGFYAHKGVETAIEAMAHLINDLGAPEARLHLLGWGEPARLASLRSRAEALGIDEHVSFGSPIGNADMPSELRRHDILLFPSIWEEPLARIVQEGMASGLAVIGTLTGGTGEILRNESTGLTFPPGDARALARQIARLVRDPSLKRRLAESGREAVLERFTLPRMVDEIDRHLAAFRRDRRNEAPGHRDAGATGRGRVSNMGSVR